VPLRIYLKNGRAKVEIALGRGKDTIDKRETVKAREAKRDMDRAVKERG
jgi:SsrA-binding protein